MTTRIVTVAERPNGAEVIGLLGDWTKDGTPSQVRAKLQYMVDGSPITNKGIRAVHFGEGGILPLEADKQDVPDEEGTRKETDTEARDRLFAWLHKEIEEGRGPERLTWVSERLAQSEIDGAW